ncbi:MAG: hypothetical protein AVDCRST_MAG80-1196, partial [uncultured Rubrobacteraceae bacterium]
ALLLSLDRRRSLQEHSIVRAIGARIDNFPVNALPFGAL